MVECSGANAASQGTSGAEGHLLYGDVGRMANVEQQTGYPPYSCAAIESKRWDPVVVQGDDQGLACQQDHTDEGTR